MKSIRELIDLNGRVAVITGAVGHIGSAFAEAFAELHASVVLLDRNEARLGTCAQSLRGQYGTETLAFPVDLEDEQKTRQIPRVVLEKFGRIDILVHCAALVGTSDLEGWAVPFSEQRSDTWRRALEVNLTAAFILTQAAAPALKESGHGSVITMGSIYGMVGPDMGLYGGTTLGNPAAYNASKGGILQLTRYLATVLAPDIRVNCISPGGVERGQTDPFLSRYIARTPLKRMAKEEDLKGAAVYLASDLSSYVTGQNIVVDGGWTAW